MSDRLGRFVDALDHAWSQAQTTPAPTTLEPSLTLDDAYAIQDHLVARRVGPANQLAGWKLGLTSGPSESGPIVGTILESMVVASGTTCHLSSLVVPQVEAEVFVVIGEDLLGPVTLEQLAAGPHSIAAGIEVIDYRTAGSTGPVDWVADNSTVGYAVVGPSRLVTEVAPAGVEVELSRDGETLARGRGELVMGNPLAAVAWLSMHLADRGLALRRGDVILTGSLTRQHPVPPGVESWYRAEFGDLGIVEVGFVP